MNVRKLALDAINKIKRDKAYSNIVVNEYLGKFELTESDKAFFTNLVYGTIQNYITLEYYLSPYIASKKVKPYIYNLLLMSIYQLAYLNMKEYAVINEAVNIANIKDRFLGNFVNAVLHSFIKSPVIDIAKDNPLYLSIKYSTPKFIVDMFIRDYGYEKAEKILMENMNVKKDAIRVNTLKASKDEVITKLKDDNIVFKDTDLVCNGLIVEENLASHSLFYDGKITIQDISSQMVAEILNPQMGSIVIDLCAAPGGKTSHIASLLNNSGVIHACDIYPHKIKLMEKNFERLGITNVITQLVDARRVSDYVKEKKVDIVLLDAPCSGLGVIGHKVDLKYHITKESIEDIIALQNELLENNYNLVKESGILLYSTCTINKDENELQIRKFLKRHEDFLIEDERLILPYEHHTDGFYICKLRRRDGKSL